MFWFDRRIPPKDPNHTIPNNNIHCTSPLKSSVRYSFHTPETHNKQEEEDMISLHLFLFAWSSLFLHVLQGNILHFQNITPSFSEWTTTSTSLPVHPNHSFFATIDQSTFNEPPNERMYFYSGGTPYGFTFDFSNETYGQTFNLAMANGEDMDESTQSFTFLNNITYASLSSTSPTLFMISLNGIVSSVDGKNDGYGECS